MSDRTTSTVIHEAAADVSLGTQLAIFRNSGLVTPPGRPGFLGQIDQYEILGVIDKGGMGIALKAYCPQRDTIVAIKTILPELAADREIRRRFAHEARAMKEMSHPGILKVLELVERPDAVYYVMPYITGGSLADRIADGKPMDPRQVLPIALALADALRYAHDERGVIHRDIKPRNVLLDEKDRPLLCDFGLVRSIVQSETIVTTDSNSKWTVGTLYYMAPELLENKAGGYPVDIYSFGAMLYEMLGGNKPYTARSNTMLMRQIVEGPPRPLGEVNPRIPAAWLRLVGDAMARKPRDRYATMEDVHADLECIQRGMPIRGARSAAPAIPTTSAVTPPPLPAQAAPPPLPAPTLETSGSGTDLTVESSAPSAASGSARPARSAVEQTVTTVRARTPIMIDISPMAAPTPAPMPVSVPPLPAPRPVDSIRPRGSGGRLFAVVTALLLVGGSAAAVAFWPRPAPAPVAATQPTTREYTADPGYVTADRGLDNPAPAPAPATIPSAQSANSAAESAGAATQPLPAPRISRLEKLREQLAGFISNGQEEDAIAFIDAINKELPRSKPADPFHAILAVQHNRVKVIKHLVEMRAQLGDVERVEGNTLLHIAAERNYGAMCRLLVAGAKFDPRGHNALGKTAASLAAQLGNSDALEEILKLVKTAGLAADDLRDSNGNTPLHAAAENGQLQAIRILLNFGAGATARNNRGEMPADLATGVARPEIRSMLLERGNFM